MVEKLTITDLPLELINRIAIYSQNLEFCLEFAERYTIKKVYNKKIHDANYFINHPNLNVLEILLKQRKLKNTQELLVISVHLNIIGIVKLLLEYGVDVEQNGEEMLFCAVLHNRVEILKLLVEYGCNPAMNGNEAMHIAAECNSVDVVRYLLTLHKRYRISTAPRHHYAFRTAAERGYHEIVELFLNPPKTYTKKVNINAQMGYAIRHASMGGREKVVKILIKYGADLTHYDNLALRLAAEYKHLSICKILIDAMLE
jgi:ankyrin repeat protein